MTFSCRYSCKSTTKHYYHCPQPSNEQRFITAIRLVAVINILSSILMKIPIGATNTRFVLLCCYYTPTGCENFIPKTPPGEPERSVTTIAAPSTTKLPSPCPARGSDQAPAAPEFFHFPQTEESGEYSEEVKQFDRQTYKEHQQYFASVQQEHMMRSAQTNQHSHQSLPLVGSDLHRKRAGRLQHCSQLASYNQRLQSRREYCQQEQSLQAGQVGQQLVQTRAHHHAAYRRQHSSLLAAAAQANANQESRQETNLSKDRHFWNFLDQLIVD